MNPQDIMKKLQEPFPANEIEWRVGSTNSDKTKGLALAYVTNRAIQNRLDEVFGPMGWQNEFKEWKGNSQICGISVWDDSKKQWITKWDGADDSQTEAVKGGLSDSMKRAGYQWGIGRYLYNLDSQWVQLEQAGRSYRIKPGCEPKLPSWALPQGNILPPPQAPSTGQISVPESMGGAEYNNPGASQEPKPISKAQLGKIIVLCGEKKIDEPTGKTLIKERYQKENLKDLNVREASDFITYLSA